ncbi:winged helix-turn-helix domain-containing protein [Streptomyces cadmiisoli]|uniref:winged helix-turn-helix domain-containing protein n=1 Tax=Streptomyces cadmiisoli TaxID=2184053 RepID=UPI0036678289
MRYAHGGGLTPKEQEKRERVRLEAAGRSARGEETGAVAGELRVTSRSVRRWRREWEQGGADALRSKGLASVERLSREQWERLERELRRGPLAHGWDGEFQGWTLKRVKLLIWRTFHVGYTVQGVWKLLRRHGWSPPPASTFSMRLPPPVVRCGTVLPGAARTAYGISRPRPICRPRRPDQRHDAITPPPTTPKTP